MNPSSPDPTSHSASAAVEIVPAERAAGSSGQPPVADDNDALAATVDLRKGFGRDQVLRGVSMRIRRGELVGLMGRSGSGKSTLLHVLGGLDREFTGSVRLFGQDLASLSDQALSQLRNARIGFVFQSFHLLDHVSCVDNVLLPNAFAATPLGRKQAVEQAREALHRVGLGDRWLSRPSELSGGQKQRVAIARALLFSPELLLCDEPTGNLDAHTGQQIIELFARLNQDGLTMLLVTHEQRVAQAAGRILRLLDGQLVTGSAADALSEPLPEAKP
jgi:putative ABC transport system ATP-binding protein